MSEKGEITFRGVAASGGICRGRVFVLGTRHLHVPHRVITEGEITGELKRLEQSIVATRKQLTKLHQSLCEQVDSQDADIFEAHLLVLEDQALIDETTKLVECDLCNVEYAYQKVTNKYAKALESMEDDYLRERAVDLRDVSTRLLSHLLGHAEEDYLYNNMREPCIVVGHDLTPSTTVMLDRKMVLGLSLIHI